MVAAVGGEKITDTDVQRQIAMVTRGQTNLPKGILAMYIPNIINQLIEQKAMAYKAKEMGLTISDQELADSIQASLPRKWAASSTCRFIRLTSANRE